MEVIHINKNGQKVLLDDYLYTNNLLGRITYIGHMRKVVQSHCKWSLKTFLALDKPASDASHNHEPDPASVCVTKANPNLNRPERNQVTSLPWRSLIFPMMPNYALASKTLHRRWMGSDYARWAWNICNIWQWSRHQCPYHYLLLRTRHQTVSQC